MRGGEGKGEREGGRERGGGREGERDREGERERERERDRDREDTLTSWLPVELLSLICFDSLGRNDGDNVVYCVSHS